MERKIEAKLMNWKNERFQALLIKGARQIGKSYSVEHFLAKEFRSYKEVNFANDAFALESFQLIKDYDDFEAKLSLLFGDVADDSNVAIFFDEIQLLYHRRRQVFVIEKDGEPLPIEIKSGKSNPDCTYNHKALNHCLSTNHSIRDAYVFSEENIFQESDVITNYPTYLIAFLENDRPNPFED